MGEEFDNGAARIDIKQLMLIGTAVASGLMLLVAVVSMFLIIVLKNEVGMLEEQGRKTAKATKAMQEELTALRESLLPPTAKAVAPVGEAPPPELRPANIDAVDSSRDCVVRSGDKGGVANCMGIEPKPAH